MDESKVLALRENMELGDIFAKSGMFADIKSAAQAIVKIQAGSELGIPPFAAMTGIYVVQGKVALSAGLIAGRIKASGKYDYRVTRLDDTGCAIEFYQGEDKLGDSVFATEDAKKAGVLNNPTWSKYPRNMFFARALTNGARWYCPDVFSGAVYTPDELGGDAIDADFHVVAEPKKTEAPKPEPKDEAPIVTEGPNGEAQVHWFDVGNTKGAVAVWLKDTFGVTIDAVHDEGKKMHDFASKDEFKTWAAATFKPLAKERVVVEQLAAELGGVVAT